MLLALVLEAASFALWWWSEGRPFSHGEARRLRQAAVAGGAAEPAEAAADAPAGQDAAAGRDLRRAYLAEEMLHPFLGYVLDPDVALLPEYALPRLPVGNLGFHRRPENLGQTPTVDGPPPQVRSAQRYRVGVFGGSVAHVFSIAGAQALARELADAGVVDRAERVEVLSFALGGYKQPQQLMALAWMLALGEPLDAVVNLDGFNDVALTLLENADRGLYPYYPRAWPQRVGGVPDPRYQALQGEVVFLRQRRAERARRFRSGAGHLLALTVTGNLVWRSLDRRAAVAVADAEGRLAEYKTPRRRPAVARGPDFDRDDREAVVAGSIALWARASRQMHDLCAARGIAYHHFLQPNQYVPGSKRLSAAERRRAWDEDSVFRPVVVEAYPRLASAGEELAAAGVAFHDLRPLFAAVEETVYVDDCCHLNRRGNRLLATAVARALAAELAAPAAP